MAVRWKAEEKGEKHEGSFHFSTVKIGGERWAAIDLGAYWIDGKRAPLADQLKRNGYWLFRYEVDGNKVRFYWPDDTVIKKDYETARFKDEIVDCQHFVLSPTDSEGNTPSKPRSPECPKGYYGLIIKNQSGSLLEYLKSHGKQAFSSIVQEAKREQ